MKKKITVVTTNRADYDHIFWLISELKKEKNIILNLIVSGSHLEKRFGNSIEYIQKDFKNFNKVYLNLKGDKSEDILEVISDGIKKFSKILKKAKPNYLIILGDRYEMLAVGISANFLKIPIIHLNGGELTFGSHDDWIRHCLTKISDIHFVANSIYKKRVIQLGESPKNVYDTGGLSSDNVKKTKKLNRLEIEKELGITFKKKNILVTYHPETQGRFNNLKSMAEIIKSIKFFKEVNFFITCPNADEGNKKLIELIKKSSKSLSNCVFFHSLGRTKYVSLLHKCDVMLGNSSSGLMEAPYLSKYTINLGNRQEGRLKTKSILDCKCNFVEIKKTIKRAYTLIKKDKDNEKKSNNFDLKDFYGYGNSADKMAKIIKRLPIILEKKKIFYDLWKNS